MERIDSEHPLYRVIDKVIPEGKEALFERINGTEQLRIKFGTDPTGRDLHFGHAVNLWAMRQMQERGHKVDLVIGDVTARIGDPTGRNQERSELSSDEVRANAELFLAQIRMVLLDADDVFALHQNSTWFKVMNAIDFIDNTLRRTTLSALTERNDFKKRIQEGHPVHGHELVYQLLQGYDSVHLKSDIALCGDDQLTNELMGRHLQQSFGQRPQDILTTRLTPGIDGGKKQSKSIGNYIGLNHSPEEQFRRVMSIPDNLIKDYFEVYTDLNTSNIQSLVAQYLAKDPRGLKKILAKEMLRRYHREDVLAKAAESYERTAKSEAPDDIITFTVPKQFDLVDFAATHFKMSKSEFIRLILGNGVSLNGRKLGKEDLTERKLLINLDGTIIVKYGKNKWARLVVVE